MIWIILLYLAIGGLITIITLAITHKSDISFRVFLAMTLTWPFFIVDILLGLLDFILVEIWKLVTIVLVSRIFWFIAAVAFFCFIFFRSCDAHAATITGEKHLVGLPVIFEHKTELFYDPEDLELLAQVLEHENYSNGERALYLTGAVVINRRNRPKWPNTIHDVVYQKGQYSTTGKFWSRPVHDECYRIASWLLIFGCPDVPETVVFQATFKQGSGVYEHEGDYFCYE